MHGVSHLLLEVTAPLVMGISPTAVTDGADIDKGDVELAFFDFRNLDIACGRLRLAFGWVGWWRRFLVGSGRFSGGRRLAAARARSRGGGASCKSQRQ